MKKVLLVVAVACFAFATPACKKCSTCTFNWNDGTGDTYTYPEKCGKKKDVQAYEDACATAAASVGSTCNCSKS